MNDSKPQDINADIQDQDEYQAEINDIVVSKGDGRKHLVIDYRALNKVTRKSTWPMPKVEDMFSKLNGATYFTTLDLQAGYHHIPWEKTSILEMDFNLPFGKCEHVKVPFGLAQAPAYFQEPMDWYFEGLQLCECLPRQYNNI